MPGAGGGENWERLVKGYKLSVTRLLKSENLMDNMVTTVDNTLLHHLNFANIVELVFSRIKKKEVTIWGDGCVNSVVESLHNV